MNNAINFARRLNNFGLLNTQILLRAKISTGVLRQPRLNANEVEELGQSVTDDFKKQLNSYLCKLSADHTSFCNDYFSAFYNRCVRHNVFGGKFGRALLCLFAYKTLNHPTNEPILDYRNALKIAALIEIFQGSLLMLDDYMDKSTLRRNKKPWYLLKNRGAAAGVDSLFMYNLIMLELGKIVKDPLHKSNLMNIFAETLNYTIYGQNLDSSTSSVANKNIGEIFTPDYYTQICTYKTAYYTAIMPMKLALYMNFGNTDEMLGLNFGLIKNLGIMFQLRDDYIGLYVDPEISKKESNDINEKKCTWFIVDALRNANPTQLDRLKECYGAAEGQEIVMDIYSELKLKNKFRNKYFSKLCDLEKTTLKSPMHVPISFFTNKLHKLDG